MKDYILIMSRITNRTYSINYDKGICKVYKHSTADIEVQCLVGIYSGIVNALNEVSIDIQNDINMKEGQSIV